MVVEVYDGDRYSHVMRRKTRDVNERGNISKEIQGGHLGESSAPHQMRKQQSEDDPCQCDFSNVSTTDSVVGQKSGDISDPDQETLGVLLL